MLKRPPTEFWSIDAPLRPLSGGSRNAVFCTTGLRRNIVFKSTRRNEAALAWLGDVHDAAEQSGFMVPRLIFSDRGKLVEHGWTAEPFLAGRPIPDSDRPALLSMIQKFQMKAERLPQRPGFLAAQDLIEHPAGGDIDFTKMPGNVVQACRDAFADLGGAPETIVHADLSPSNVLGQPDGRIALVDWDEARRDVPVFDLGHLGEADAHQRKALLAWETACCWLTEPERAERLAQKLLTFGASTA